jgi:carboxyvinyl-carboxyphosphonate phosphorylmutase
MTVLGAPDVIVLTLTEFAAQAHRICRAANLPLLCDADHGYGNALNVMRTVEELETAGVAGLSIEDTDLPVPFGSAKPRLISIEEGVGKMRAAIAARRDSGLVIAGRTSAPSVSSLADTIARARAYEAAGVDAVFLVGIRSRGDLDTIAAEVKLPLILGGAGKELTDRDWLAQRGVRICLQGHQPFAAAVRAVHDTLRALRDGTTPPEKIETQASDALMKRVTRSEDYARWMKDWL